MSDPVSKIIAAMVVVLLIIGAWYLGTQLKGEQQEVACSYYKNTTMKNIPARCVHYFEGDTN